MKLTVKSKYLYINLNILGIVLTLMFSIFYKLKTLEIGTSLIFISMFFMFFKHKETKKLDFYTILIFLSFLAGTTIMIVYLITNKLISFPPYPFGDDMKGSLIRAKFAVGLVIFNAYVFGSRLNHKEKLDYLYLFYVQTSIVVVLIFFTSLGSMIDIWKTPKRLHGFSFRPTQLSSILSFTFFLGFYFYKQKRIKKIYFYFVLILTSIVAILTESEALVVAVATSYLILIFFKAKSYFFKKDRKLAIKILFYFISAMTLISPFVLYFLFDHFNDGRGQASGRLNIWWNSLRATSYSPLFGFGPGSYSGVDNKPFVGKEAHNTILDFLGYGGFIFLSIITFMYIKILKSIKFDNYLILSLISITIYGLFHNNGRAPYLWLSLFFLFSIKDKFYETK